MKRTFPAVPQLAERILRFLYSQDYYLERSGDLEEAYADMVEEAGPFWAKIWLLFQILKLCFGLFRMNIVWKFIMLKNYIKITFRNINRHKSYSFINIVGLAVGMACCILLFLWVDDELSYDKFNTKADRIYRAFIEATDAVPPTRYTSTPIGLAPYLKREFPEIKDVTRLKISDPVLINFEEKSFMEEGFCYADDGIFKIFSITFISGDPNRAFEYPNSIVINEKTAERYFGNDNPLGKTLRVQNQHDFFVTGIVKNLPRNSTLQFDFLIPFTFLGNLGLDLNTFRRYDRYLTYILVNKAVSIDEISEKISGTLKIFSPNSPNVVKLQPLRRIQLFGLSNDGKYKYVVLISILAVFILIIACINFMNLTTARSTTRAREVGLRKVVGAKKRDLVSQFLGESLLFSLLSLIIAIALVSLFLPLLNQLSGKELSMNFLFKLKIWIGLVIISSLTGILAGSYPAIFLSSFQPMKILKSNYPTGSRKSALLRKILVVTQFSPSIFLIIGTLTIYNQLNYIKNKDLGYSRNQIICLPLHKDIANRYTAFKNELLRNPEIPCMTRAGSFPHNMMSETSYVKWKGKDPEKRQYFAVYAVDIDFIKTFEMDVVDGLDFSSELITDKHSGIILNQTAVTQIGFDSPVGQWFSLWNNDGKVIGVVKDFNFKSFYHKIGPLVFSILPDFYAHIMIRVSPENISGSLSYIEKMWEKFVPAFPFQYSFLDQEYDALYKTEKMLGELLSYSGLLAIFISLLGLFSLASFLVQQRTKEVAIRKVMGASVPKILSLQFKELMEPVVLANIIAWPFSYYFACNWLKSFAYRVNINVWIFILSGLIALTIAILTVSYHTIKSATANPVDSLRYE